MRLVNPFEDLAIGQLFETLLPDFVLAFAFFTSICYAVLGKRFGQQRPAIAMSTTIGFALSVGLVWWEQANDFSIKDLSILFYDSFAVLNYIGKNTTIDDRRYELTLYFYNHRDEVILTKDTLANVYSIKKQEAKYFNDFLFNDFQFDVND